MAMGMTEDDNGVIWSVIYPHSGMVAFDPATTLEPKRGLPPAHVKTRSVVVNLEPRLWLS